MKIKGKCRKIISLFLIIAMLLSALLAITSCTSGFDDTKYAIISENNLTDDGLVYSIYENNTVVITGRQVDYDQLIIPDEVGGKPVVEIGESAFEGDETLVLLTIGKNVKIIGDSAFSDCINLVRVEASENLKKISSSAFYACSRLAEFIGATAIEYIDEVAFYNCTVLAYFDFPETLTTINNEAFSGCESLTEIVLPSKIKTVGVGAFSYCLSLTRVSMGNLESVADRMLLNCVSLESVTVARKAKAIGAHAFRGCSILKSITVPKTVKSVGEAAFAQCEALKNVNYGGSEGDFSKISYGAENDFFSGASVAYNQKIG